LTHSEKLRQGGGDEVLRLVHIEVKSLGRALRHHCLMKLAYED
jgi:hypothetical protein